MNFSVFAEFHSKFLGFLPTNIRAEVVAYKRNYWVGAWGIPKRYLLQKSTAFTHSASAYS